MGKALTKEEVQKRISETFIQKVELIGEYKNRRSNITLHCLNCDHTWSISAQSVLYSSHSGANHICPKCGRKQQEKVFCAWCGKELERKQSQIDRNISGYFYCCREHGNLHKNQLRRESGEWEDSNNYRLKAFSQYEHKCACCDWNEDERILEVHHIDENHENNDLNNLIILCPTCHRKITLGYYYLDLNTKKLIKKGR